MFARAEFNQFSAGNYAVSNARVIRAFRRLPPGAVRSAVLGFTWLETWLRWPLATLKLGDQIDETLAVIDPDGDRYGFSEPVRRRFKRNILYYSIADLFSLMNALEREDLREETLTIRGAEILEDECQAGPGAIVAGFRTGPYPAFPWAVAAAAPGRDVVMIVSTEQLASLARKLGETFIGRLNERVSFLSAQDSGVLAKSLRALKAGGIVATLLELSPVEFARKTPVSFLDWRIEVPYGLSYLSAITARPVIPAALTRRRGARFGLRFRESVPAAARDQESLRGQTQQLYAELERHVRRVPEQWIGWMLLESNMGIHLPVSGGRPLPALS